jgi:hypothetical protein
MVAAAKDGRQLEKQRVRDTVGIMRKLLLAGLLFFGLLFFGIASGVWVNSISIQNDTTVGRIPVTETAEVGGGVGTTDWAEYTRTNGTEAALTMLVERGKKDPTFASTCHTAAHEIGQVAAGVIELREALELEPERCLNGYTHGLLQILAGDPDTVFADLLSACAQAKGGKMATECVHGSGHLLALRHPSSLTAALAECVNLETSLQDWCVGGTMMEYGQNYLAQRWPAEYSEISRTMGPDRPTPIDLTDGETDAPCTLIPEVGDKYQCWSEMGPFILANSDDLGAVSSMSEKCRNTSETAQWACLYSLFAWLTDNLDVGGDDVVVLGGIVENLCNQVKADLLAGCLNGAIYRIGLPRDIEVVEAICARREGTWASGCAEGVETARTSQKNAGVE